MKLKKKIVFGSVPALALIVVLCIVAIYGLDSLSESNESVNKTHLAIQKAMEVESAAMDMETGMHGYLLAGKEGFLEPYNDGKTRFERMVGQLKEAVGDDSEQLQLLAGIKKTVDEWKEKVAEHNVSLRREIGDAETMNDMAKLIGEERGKKYFDKFRHQINLFIQNEVELIRERKNKLDEAKSSAAGHLYNIKKTRFWVDHTYNVINKSELVLEYAIDMETGIRGFLLAGQENFLEPFRKGKDKFFMEIRELRDSVSDDPALAEKLAEGEKLIQDWIDNVANPALKLRKEVNAGLKDMEDVERFVLEKGGAKYIGAFREIIADFIAVESDLVVERRQMSGEAEAQIQLDISAMNDAMKWVDHTHNVIQTAGNILAAAVDMETGMRGFLLAGKENFLEPFVAGEKRFFDLVADLKFTVSDDLDQIRLLGEIEATMKEWNKNVAAHAIGLRREIGDSKTMDDMADLIGQARGKQYFDKFREQIKTFKDRENANMDGRLEKAKKAAAASDLMIVVFGVSAIIIALVISYFISAGIVKPVNRVVEGLKDMAEGEGDLTRKIEIRSRDEIGELAHWFNTFVSNLRLIIEDLSRTATPLYKSSEELNTISAQMAASAEEMNSQANMVAASSGQVAAGVSTVAAASEEASSSIASISSMAERMSSTFNDVAEFARKTSDNVNRMAESSGEMSSQINTVAAAVEEMTSSLNDVAKNTVKGSDISRNASRRTEDINNRMAALVAASKQIGKVVVVIKDIADQTNMLALNATIEAAGAGDAGKGFAVVAGEVKELARQSAEATDEIAGQIEEIQAAIDGGSRAVEEINTVISEIADINTMIATSAEEQSDTAGEISKSLARAASNVKTVSESSGESAGWVKEIAKSTDDTAKSAVEIAKSTEELRSGASEAARSSSEAELGVKEISKNIQAISVAAKQTSAGAVQTSESSKELAQMARTLMKIVERFRV